MRDPNKIFGPFCKINGQNILFGPLISENSIVTPPLRSENKFAGLKKTHKQVTKIINKVNDDDHLVAIAGFLVSIFWRANADASEVPFLYYSVIYIAWKTSDLSVAQYSKIEIKNTDVVGN